MATGLEALVAAARSVLLDDSVIATVPVSNGDAEHNDPLPYILTNFYATHAVYNLGPNELYRQFRGQFRVCAPRDRGMATAEPLKSAIFTRFTDTIGGHTPQYRLNAYLSPNWASDIILEAGVGEIPPYIDYVGKDTDPATARYNTGVQFEFRIHRI